MPTLKPGEDRHLFVRRSSDRQRDFEIKRFLKAGDVTMLYLISTDVVRHLDSSSRRRVVT